MINARILNGYIDWAVEVGAHITKITHGKTMFCFYSCPALPGDCGDVLSATGWPRWSSSDIGSSSDTCSCSSSSSPSSVAGPSSSPNFGTTLVGFEAPGPLNNVANIHRFSHRQPYIIDHARLRKCLASSARQVAEDSSRRPGIPQSSSTSSLA